ncbi:MAG: glycosyltransferase [Acidobacteriota bacterium]
MSSAGGIQLFRLLEDYPASQLRVVETRRVSGERLACRYDELATPALRFEQSRLFRWKRSLDAIRLVPSASISRVDSLLESFRPEVVLCVMQRAASYERAREFAHSKGLPLIAIVHDVNDEFESVFPFARVAARRRDRAFYRFASRRLCVSPEMEELCAALYGVSGSVLYPNRSEELKPRPFEQTQDLRSPGTLTVGFAGNLNYGYGDELERLLIAFRAARARLVLFGNPPTAEGTALLDSKDCCEFRGFARTPMEAWHAIQTECDAVILPYRNPAGPWERLYSHHFPSKLSEYLVLGMPVLVTGPDTATGVKWALNHPEAAVACTTLVLNERTCLLRRLRDDRSWRRALAEGAYRAGLEEFDPRKTKADFLDHIRAVAVERA